MTLPTSAQHEKNLRKNQSERHTFIKVEVLNHDGKRLIVMGKFQKSGLVHKEILNAVQTMVYNGAVSR